MYLPDSIVRARTSCITGTCAIFCPVYVVRSIIHKPGLNRHSYSAREGSRRHEFVSSSRYRTDSLCTVQMKIKEVNDKAYHGGYIAFNLKN